MNEWAQVSEADAARIRSGGAWAYRDGQLVPVSIAAISEQLQAALPARIQSLAERLAIESRDDVEGLELVMSDDLSEVTLTLRGNGHVAEDTFPITSPVVT